jgi:hypothetical protein
MKMEAGTEVLRPQAKQCQWSLEVGTTKKFSPHIFWRSYGLTNKLALSFWSPELKKDKFGWF